MTYRDLKRDDNQVEGSEKLGVKWREVKISGRMGVLSQSYSYAVRIWVTVQYDVLLSYCFIVSLLFA